MFLKRLAQFLRTASVVSVIRDRAPVLWTSPADLAGEYTARRSRERDH